jgi:hypothetical protein
VAIFAADNPMDDCEELEGFFPSVSPITLWIKVLHISL